MNGRLHRAIGYKEIVGDLTRPNYELATSRSGGPSDYFGMATNQTERRDLAVANPQCSPLSDNPFSCLSTECGFGLERARAFSARDPERAIRA